MYDLGENVLCHCMSVLQFWVLGSADRHEGAWLRGRALGWCDWYSKISITRNIPGGKLHKERREGVGCGDEGKIFVGRVWRGGRDIE